TGQVRKNGHMYVDGALWRIESTEQLEVGDRVQILEINGLTMKVKRTD
ncbi:MAG: NfeD family protein, partial [Candidatus Zixiibacteriota bacterium]